MGEGVTAHDIALPTPDGRLVQLSDEWSSGPLLLAFFKQECGASQVALPRLPRIAQTYPGVRVLAISQEDPATTAELIAEQAPGMNTLVDDPDYEASRAYGVQAVPALYLVDRQGSVVATQVGWDRDRFNELSVRIAELVGASYTELVPEGDGPAFRPG